MPTPDMAIVGAGVIGCSLARELAGRGAKVILIDRAAPGGEASHAAAGMLAPSAEAEHPSPLFEFAAASLRMYQTFAAALADETGIDVQYRDEGTLRPFASPAAAERMRAAIGWQSAHGVAVEEYSAAQARAAEPELAAPHGALFLAGDHQVDNRLLMQALVSSCRLRGVEMQLGVPALRVRVEVGAATGVQVGPAASPRTIAAGVVVNASGAWAAQLTGQLAGQLNGQLTGQLNGKFAGEAIPVLPIRPVKGHMLALRAAPQTLRHVVRAEDVYLVPRLDGRIIVGSTMEEAGFDKRVEAAPVERLLAAAQRVCPTLAKAEFLEAWTGLRPATPDSLPIIGPLASGPLATGPMHRESISGQAMPGVANYWCALGHFRNGILLAPVTAHTLAKWITTGHPPANLATALQAFSATRFIS